MGLCLQEDLQGALWIQMLECAKLQPAKALQLLRVVEPVAHPTLLGLSCTCIAPLQPCLWSHFSSAVSAQIGLVCSSCPQALGLLWLFDVRLGPVVQSYALVCASQAGCREVTSGHSCADVTMVLQVRGPDCLLS